MGTPAIEMIWNYLGTVRVRYISVFSFGWAVPSEEPKPSERQSWPSHGMGFLMQDNSKFQILVTQEPPQNSIVGHVSSRATKCHKYSAFLNPWLNSLYHIAYGQRFVYSFLLFYFL